MISIEGMTKSYMTMRGRKYVFRDMTFQIPPGHNIGLIGRNGAGKSTMMRLLSGVDLPDKGKIRTPSKMSWPVGLSGGMQSTLSARENVRFVCRLHGLDDPRTREVVEFVSRFAEIGSYFDQPISTYSSGMRGRVAFGTSMAFEFDYYLIDEAMGTGDAGFKAKSKAVFDERLQTAKVILTSHSMNLIRKMCTVVVLLEGGRARLYYDPEEGIAAYEALGVRR